MVVGEHHNSRVSFERGMCVELDEEPYLAVTAEHNGSYRYGYGGYEFDGLDLGFLSVCPPPVYGCLQDERSSLLSLPLCGHFTKQGRGQAPCTLF